MAERKFFHDSVISLPRDGAHAPLGLVVQACDQTRMAEPMRLHFSFAPPDGWEQGLAARIAAGETVAPDLLAAAFKERAPEIAQLARWLEEAGFRILETRDDGLYAEAPADLVARALEVEIVRVTRDGRTHNAARTVPSLPARLAAHLQGIGGLQPFLRAHRHNRRRTPKSDNRATLTGPVTGLARQSAERKFAPPYLVGEILKAYQADGLGVSGAGQTIAILIDTFPEDSDLAAFWKANGIAADPAWIEKINVGGGSLPAPEGEETLDAEWTSGIAPGAKIRIYASGSLSFVDLDRALDRILADLAAEPGLRQLSISLGLGETYLGGPGGEMATQHQKYLRLAAAGVNVFVSSGDAGSNPDQTGHASDGPTQTEYGASDPYVIGVGGTTLVMASDGTVSSETGWTDSGGGQSHYFPRPGWQTGKTVPAGTKRLVPDVAATADPEDGAFLVLAGKVVQIGGTSWSAPVWAGFSALINEARLKAGKTALPFLNPLLYPLAGSDAFRDILAGSNGQYAAKAGYDMVTGLGVPNLKALLAALVATGDAAGKGAGKGKKKAAKPAKDGKTEKKAKGGGKKKG